LNHPKLTRRSFLLALAATPLIQRDRALDLAAIERPRVLRAADKYLTEAPVTITASRSARSAGGLHDYFSEGDYWWPDPAHPGGPYIQKDGMTNPDNFVAHRHALIRLSLHVPALAAAWSLTRDRRYAAHAVTHLRAWFLDAPTRMNPHLLYAQAIHGRFTGRGIGIIDTLHLVEVVRAIGILEQAGVLSTAERDGVREWFEQYLTWMTTHPYGQAERDAKNNHGTCWVLQVAEFARYTRRSDLTAFCRDRFKTVIVPGQVAPDGSFPEELRRTKPYGYSLFNLDAMSALCQVLSTGADDLWRFETPDGRGIAKALSFLVPFIENKRDWTYPPDVMYFDEWPVRHCLLLFGGLALDRQEYLALWRRLNPDPTVDEVIRNYFIRQPLLWVSS
jgi:Alginate lyase